MEDFTLWILPYAQHAPWIIFGLLLLAGLNVPISEDLMLIAGGIALHAQPPAEIACAYGIIFLGCWVSAWEAYWIGRLMGPRIHSWGWISRTVTPERIERLRAFYQKHGFLTLLVGRFIPFGVRNILFITAGLSKTPFLRFILRDLIPCLLSSSVLFFAAVYLGKNSSVIYEYFHLYERTIGTLLLALIAVGGLLFIRTRYQRKRQARAL